MISTYLRNLLICLQTEMALWRRDLTNQTLSRVELGLKHGLAVLEATIWPTVEPVLLWLQDGRPRSQHPAGLNLSVEDVAVELPLTIDLLQHKNLSVAFTTFGFLALGYN